LKLNPLETKILNYIKYSNCKYLLSPSIDLISSKKLPGQSFKYLKRVIKEGDSKALEAKLISYFEKFNINYTKKDEYFNKQRQKVHRLKNKLLGKKQLNFYVDSELYNSLQSLKSELNLNYSELLEYLIKNSSIKMR